MNDFISIWLKFFFLFTPFSALSMFLTLTAGYSQAQRNRLSLQVAGAVAVLCFVLYFFGTVIFSVFGITIDAFRVGAGALLFISAVGLAQAKGPKAEASDNQDIAVVPLAIPIIVGPATIGTLLVMGVEKTGKIVAMQGYLALLVAILSVWIVLRLGSYIERWLGARGINILSKISGLILAALAAQMMLMGIRDFLS
jgi:multiple antibiotic resistance protein